LTVRAGLGQRPVFTRSASGPPSAAITLSTPHCAIDITGVLVSGLPLRLTGRGTTLHVSGCSFDPESVGASLVVGDDPADSTVDISFDACVTGQLTIGSACGALSLTDSIVGRAGLVAIGGQPVALTSPLSPPGAPRMLGTLQLLRTTVLGQVSATVLYASDVVFTDIVQAVNQTAGCVRYSRFEPGSQLPARFRSTSAPIAFGSRHFGRADYARLVAGTDDAVLSTGEAGAEPGAFAAQLERVRLSNLQTKLREFMPLSMVPVVIGQT
jgi:hypothetical protein